MDIELLDEQTLRCGDMVFRCAIGKAGLIAAEDKREGDHKTPCGSYALRAGYFRPDKLKIAPQTGLPLVEIRPDMGWCDDPAHARYNQLVKVPSPIYGGGLGRGGEAGRFGEGDFTTRRREIMNNARALRKNTTDAEKYLWQMLRNKQLGAKFRRQHNVGSYIADFACIEKHLIIELDGGQHVQQVPYDAKRDAYLSEAGFMILRFWNNDLFERTEGVLMTIWNALHSPTPTLPRRRGRELGVSLPPTDASNYPPRLRGGIRGGTSDLPFSYENLWREDDCYDLIVPIGYNDDPIVQGKGSAIFLHVAKPDYSGTEGCVALAKDDLIATLACLTMGSRIRIPL